MAVAWGPFLTKRIVVLSFFSYNAVKCMYVCMAFSLCALCPGVGNLWRPMQAAN